VKSLLCQTKTRHNMRLLGIDFGLKRVGLAVSGPSGNLVFPLKTIVRTTRQAMFDELLNLISEENIEAIVLGIPLGPEGEETLTMSQILNFKKSLERRVDLPVHIINEAFTSCEAMDIMKQRRVKHDKIKQSLDQVAAVLILETFLNQRGS
jgi:putative holliday junction resolvase